MAQKSLYDQDLTHDEIKYREHFQRGQDFIKIELFLSAREEFRAALKYRPDDKEALEMFTTCSQQVKKDAKKVYVIVPVVLAVIAAVILLS